MRSMKTSTRTAGATMIVDVVGEIDLSSSPAFRRTLFAALQENRRVAINLVGVRYIDSSAIASLIEILKEARRLGTEFVLFGLSPRVHDVLKLTHVLDVFQVYETEEQAVKP
ncbi:MAG TPA: STAS domain-containing protein [Terriglobia bacterium]|nr:STAS domain-containing protein [Terriglobia bacterium]